MVTCLLLSLIIVFCGINSYTTDNSWPDYKVQTTIWDAEDSGLVTEDSDNMSNGKIKQNYDKEHTPFKMMVKRINKFFWRIV